MTEPVIHLRFAEPRLAEALADTPVVLIHGPRQSGKTTLARRVGEEAAGKRFVAGVVLYDGEASASVGAGLYAVPIRALWETR